MRSRTYHIDHPFGFLRPSAHQIVWTVMIVLLFLPFIQYDTGVRCVTVPCPSSAIASAAGYAFFHTQQEAYGVSWIILILGTIVTYIVVSLIAAVRHAKRH